MITLTEGSDAKDSRRLTYALVGVFDTVKVIQKFGTDKAFSFLNNHHPRYQHQYRPFMTKRIDGAGRTFSIWFATTELNPETVHHSLMTLRLTHHDIDKYRAHHPEVEYKTEWRSYDCVVKEYRSLV